MVSAPLACDSGVTHSVQLQSPPPAAGGQWVRQSVTVPAATSQKPSRV
jgi:hypothetical protein